MKIYMRSYVPELPGGEPAGNLRVPQWLLWLPLLMFKGHPGELSRIVTLRYGYIF
jgi:hypothetical protein